MNNMKSPPPKKKVVANTQLQSPPSAANGKSPAIIRLPEVRGRVKRCKSGIYADISAGTFPRPIPIGARAVGWLENEIEEWITKRAASRQGNTSTQEKASAPKAVSA